MSDASGALSFEDACEAVCGPGTMFEYSQTDVDGIDTTVFVHAPPNIGALYGLAAAREDEFIIYEDERWTAPQVLSMANRIGHVLVESCGITKGDRIGIAMRNYPEWVAAFVAITSVGGVAVPLNAWWQADEMAFAVGDSGASLLLVDEERLNRILGSEGDSRSTLQAVRTLVVRADAPDQAPADRPADAPIEALADLLPDEAAMPVVDVGPDDDVTILYTSGTTGNPKGAVSTHRALVNGLMCFAARAAVGALCEPPDEADLADPPMPVFMLCVPLFHVTGLVPVMLGSFVGGARLVMTHRWDPDRALELIEREAVTNFVGVPTMAWDLLEAESFGDRDLSSLRSVGGGGAPMPPELVRRIDEHFPKGRPGLGYGMTETNAYGPQNAGQDFLDRPTSTGRTIPVMQMRVTDPDGNELPTGETGELWFRGPSLIRGYWNRPDATAETIVDGWLRSGDLGSIDEDGYVYVIDRAKDMVLRGGENIYCAEVEAAIYEHPAVYEAAVYGVPHPRLGEELACHVMVKPDHELSEGELQQFIGSRLASFKVPSIVTFVGQSLPRNASGKILKRELRDQMAAEATGG
ncbi:MAG: class I adenylate-forming enzyme family protein [Actinomycetota bacterium]